MRDQIVIPVADLEELLTAVDASRSDGNCPWCTGWSMTAENGGLHEVSCVYGRMRRLLDERTVLAAAAETARSEAPPVRPDRGISEDAQQCPSRHPDGYRCQLNDLHLSHHMVTDPVVTW